MTLPHVLLVALFALHNAAMQRFMTLDRRIIAELSTASPERLRRIAIAAAAAAVDRAPDSPLLLTLAVADLRRGALDAPSRDAVMKLAAELDDLYLDLHDDEKPGGATAGWEAAFVTARAAAAVAHAYDPDPAVASREAVYESFAVIGDPAVVLEIVTATRYLS